ncbi:MAG: hypothetical protein IKG14_02670 [Clostridia bacterium]|nr:hypothetical protein [Clostridia bacterium]MBR3324935.1 hypothetical protein [Clostridia bacterium]
MGESKNLIIGVIVVVIAVALIGVGVYFSFSNSDDKLTKKDNESVSIFSDKEETVKKELEKYIKNANESSIEEVNFDEVKIYTKEEIENNELLKDYDLKPEDIVFEVNYSLKLLDGYNGDIMQFTAGTGEIDGQWVKNKYNCGIVRYNADNDYTITDFGTGF